VTWHTAATSATNPLDEFGATPAERRQGWTVEPGPSNLASRSSSGYAHSVPYQLRGEVENVMPNRVYALLVGVNDYAPDVGKLGGCLNDVDLFHEYLGRHVDKAALAVEVLKDSDATRANVIGLFRSHLRRALAGDVAVFQFCGHGARWASSAAFRTFYPDGKDEGLVCHDSRRPGGYDLADKELAVLIAEVAGNDAHVAVLLDCCHSGSGTRGVDAFRGLKPRLTHEVTTERPLESYLDGHYAAMRDARTQLFIPKSRHILLAACERGQLAQESTGHGIFTSTLVDVLEKSGGDVSYADLFVRCRAAVRSRAFDQDPQFETYDRFDAYSGFLARPTARTSRPRYLTICDQGAWTVECGAINGVTGDPGATVTLALYRDADATTPVGTARAVQVGPQRCEIALEFESAESASYMAEITSLPAAPLQVAFAGDDQSRPAVQEALDQRAVHVSLVGQRDAARYILAVENGRLALAPAGRGPEIGFASLVDRKPAEAAVALAPVLKRVAQWERCLALQNPRTAMDASKVDFVYAEQLDGGGEHPYLGTEAILDYVREGVQWRKLRGRFKVRNRTDQTLHAMLAYFSEAYGVHILSNEPIEPGDAWMTVWGDGPKDNFYLEDGVDEAVERFKLIVATEKVDDFLLAQNALTLGDEYGATRALESVQPPRKAVHRNEWVTKDFCVRVVRRVDQVGVVDAGVAGGQIVVKGHPTVTANISLSAAGTAARGVGSAGNFFAAFEQRGMALLNFSSTRGTDLSVLELTDIQNASALEAQPLEIELKLPLGKDEGVLPVVYDGQHVFLGGAPRKDDDGTTRVVVDTIPEVSDQRRGLGSSLKLYFFKTWLKHETVNQLRWVEFRDDGTVQHHETGLADKVRAARRVLLLVHGIIGDTEGMAAGVKACGLDRLFDLVIAYDYENLSTPIGDTARMLKAQLAAAGLRDGDDKHLTLLVHSMGGLVSRWFIEREGGSRVVDHLVMCGTPNNGSPFGRIEEARRILGVLTTVAMNYLPAFIPFSGAVLLLLNRSKKLTPTLEQMHPASEFIRTLNESADPGIPYTILAGDVAAYREPGDALFARMLAKTGRSQVFEALFADKANDIAVAVESILGVDGGRRTPPVRRNVACHHMNYFVSEPGQQALASVAW
jgi:pimeloyl-ACP methyl ester carboxylesterase